MNNVNGILLLYNRPLRANATTIMEHVNAFSQYSGFKVWAINTELGFPKNLQKLNFTVIILHYSLFGSYEIFLNNAFLDYLSNCQNSYKIVFIQDEYRCCKHYFGFINTYNINCIYTLLEPQYFKDVYLKYTPVPKIISCIPGYVSDKLVSIADHYHRDYEKRAIDIGYRGRELPFYIGRGGQEKAEIARIFIEKVKDLDLKLDIKIAESDRLYGNKWYEFLASCKAVLGVEAGVSVFDLEDEVYQEYKKLIAANPLKNFVEFKDQAPAILEKWEDRIYYRMISPRHFEAAAFRNCQILFEGKYSGILQPLVHYIPLKKDFSNIDQVIKLFRDQKFCQELVNNTYRDIIASKNYGYKNYLKKFDEELIAQGFETKNNEKAISTTTELLRADRNIRRLQGGLKAMKDYSFPGRKYIAKIMKDIIGKK